VPDRGAYDPKEILWKRRDGRDQAIPGGTKEWIGGKFDPEKFSVTKLNRELKQQN
jgi:hypothetical protein